MRLPCWSLSEPAALQGLQLPAPIEIFWGFFLFYVCVGVKQSRDGCNFGCFGCRRELIQMIVSLCGLRH